MMINLTITGELNYIQFNSFLAVVVEKERTNRTFCEQKAPKILSIERK